VRGPVASVTAAGNCSSCGLSPWRKVPHELSGGNSTRRAGRALWPSPLLLLDEPLSASMPSEAQLRDENADQLRWITTCSLPTRRGLSMADAWGDAGRHLEQLAASEVYSNR